VFLSGHRNRSCNQPLSQIDLVRVGSLAVMYGHTMCRAPAREDQFDDTNFSFVSLGDGPTAICFAMATQF
jgi:hypothetical protein